MTAVVKNKLNECRYGRLLARTLPKAIETDQEHERLLEEVNRLMSKAKLISHQKKMPCWSCSLR
jgi:hypothetical protein